MYEFLRLVPKNHLSNFIGRAAALRVPRPFRTWLLRLFVRAARIDVSEAEFPLEHYPSIGAYFTRRLKPTLRPIGQGVVSPVDGTLRRSGLIVGQTLPQVKDLTYSVTDFLRDDELAARFEGGCFFNLYLSPRDYHRVHAPCDGTIVFLTYIPGKLWPVNDWSLSTIENLFAINERIVMGLETAQGLVVLVMVGATNVGKMSLSFDTLVTNRGEQEVQRKHFERGVKVHAGDELGVFHLGSSVVLLFEPGRGPRTASGAEPRKVKMGETLFRP